MTSNIDVHAGKALFEDGLDAAEIDEVKSPVVGGRDNRVDVAARAGYVAQMILDAGAAYRFIAKR
jgi:hypothetical protein